METIEVEQIEVRDPRAPRARRARAPNRVRRVAAWVGGVLAAGATLLIADGVASDGTEEPAPDRIERVEPEPVAILDARQQVFILHDNWLDELATAECMGDRGYAYEPDPRRDSVRLAAIAGLLEIEPMAAVGDFASAELRNAHTRAALSSADQAVWDAALATRFAHGGCTPPYLLLYIENEEAVSAAVEAARRDQAFIAYVAQMMALESDPVAALRSEALVGVPPAAAEPGSWGDLPARVEAAVARDLIWIVEPAVETEAFVDIAGLTSDGEALLVRASASAAHLIPEGVAAGEPLTCGERTFQVATTGGLGSDPTAGTAPGADVASVVLAALTTRICAS
ncbi:hypothetical protein [uncultured Demequina sp.]|uniref:hypothetical protein n=1 Tax=uncultured Demequina sp. TaxID=693499 RepID=UPI0025EF0888|nr:hypothetical protein [uncultured Demequina sp.]